MSIFINNKYKRLYFKIINKAISSHYDCYTERHHIIPKSLNGGDDNENLVSLTPREHFICHYLLTKMVKMKSLYWYKMVKAFNMMKPSNDCHGHRYFNSRLYEANRKHMSEVMSKAQRGNKNSQAGTMWIHNNTKLISKKIPYSDDLPTGWERGRKIVFSTNVRQCRHCGKYFPLPHQDRVFCDDCTTTTTTRPNEIYPFSKVSYSSITGRPFNTKLSPPLGWNNPHKVSAKVLAKAFDFELGNPYTTENNICKAIDTLQSMVDDGLNPQEIQKQLNIKYSSFGMFLKNIGVGKCENPRMLTT